MTANTIATLLKRTAILLLLLLPISALGSRFQLWPHSVGLMLFAAALVGSLLIEVICSLWLFRKPQPALLRPLRLASLFALPPLLLTAALLRGNTSDTMLHDISTDLTNPPQFIAAQALRAENSNTLEHTLDKVQAQNKLYPEIKSITNSLSQQENYRKALQAAKDIGWQVHYTDPKLGHIEAVATTLWFGFKDDIIIIAKKNLIDLRSISRIGESDLGANAKRIKQFVEVFSE